MCVKVMRFILYVLLSLVECLVKFYFIINEGKSNEIFIGDVMIFF